MTQWSMLMGRAGDGRPGVGALERCPPEGHDGKRSLHGALRAGVLGIGLGNTRNALTAMHEQNGVSLELRPG